MSREASPPASIDLTALPPGETVDLEPGLTLARPTLDVFTLKRSPWRSAPVFHQTLGTTLRWSTCFLSFEPPTARNRGPKAVNLRYIAEYLAFQTPDTPRTIRRDVQHLRPGETQTFDWSGRLAGCKFAALGPASSRASFSGDDLRAHLVAQIEAFDPSETVFHLSSGLDSSILAILASEIFPPKAVRLATCTTKGRGATDELVNSRRLAHELGARLEVFDFNEIDVFAEGGVLIERCLGYPIAHPSHLVEFLLDRAIARTASTIVTGKGPDDALAGYPWHQPEYRARARHRDRVTVTPLPMLRRLLKCSLDGLWRYWDEASPELELTERLAYDARSITESSNIVHEAIAHYFGVRISSPFMHPSVRQGMFAVHDDLRLAAGTQKILLRKTFAQKYPDYVLAYPKTGLRLDLRPYFLQYSSRALFERIVINATVANEIFVLDEVRRLIDATLSGAANFGWQLWSIYCSMIAILATNEDRNTQPHGRHQVGASDSVADQMSSR